MLALNIHREDGAQDQCCYSKGPWHRISAVTVRAYGPLNLDTSLCGAASSEGHLSFGAMETSRTSSTRETVHQVLETSRTASMRETYRTSSENMNESGEVALSFVLTEAGYKELEL